MFDSGIAVHLKSVGDESRSIWLLHTIQSVGHLRYAIWLHYGRQGERAAHFPAD